MVISEDMKNLTGRSPGASVICRSQPLALPVEDAPDRVDRAKALEVERAGNGLLAPTPESTEPARLRHLLLVARRMPEAERDIAHRGRPARPSVELGEGAMAGYHRLALVATGEHDPAIVSALFSRAPAPSSGPRMARLIGPFSAVSVLLIAERRSTVPILIATIVAEGPVMLRSRLTERFNLDHPVISAPMGFAGGGGLAAAVSAAGGLGLIGGGYGNEPWLREQFLAAGSQRVGCGFITFSLKQQPQLLEMALDRAPAAMFLSFGDPAPFAGRIKQAGVPLLCQIQTVADARRAIEVGADVVVAQGAEAGGHGESRATFTLVPEVADLIAARAPETLLCAAGGVADGRGLAAALALGADGVVVGTRLWASDEALVHPNLQAAVVSASGDETLRSHVIDILKGYDVWPA
ncbi:MAG TPA: nitronate monooxygenase, partial [Candidatus Limnocylindrales bacterium]|nr:nitronate monooxygenase [Candidatus Limnocylindrales bacterium]